VFRFSTGRAKSLLGVSNSLLSHQKFPAPLSRELVQAIVCAHVFGTRKGLGGPFFQKFPAKFPASREFELHSRIIKNTQHVRHLVRGGESGIRTLNLGRRIHLKSLAHSRC
jgi:hypothetical protein